MSNFKINEIVEAMPPSGIRKFFDMVLEMKDVVSLGVGEPDFVTPWHICESAIYSIEQGYTSYTSNYGMMKLREKIAEYIYKKSLVVYNPANEVLITVGVSQGLDIAMRALLNQGDEVIVIEPSYVSYKPMVLLAGGTPVVMPTYFDDDFQINLDTLEALITPKTKGILINYPANPTGVTYDRELLTKFSKIAIKHDLIVFSDEVYSELTYDQEHVSINSLEGMRERTVHLSGFSKAWAMTGWRMGYIAAPKYFVDPIVKVHQYSMLCAPIAAQMASIEALDHGEEAVHKMVEEYNQRRRTIVKGLNEIGLKCKMPQGAFYAFPSVKDLPIDAEEFCLRLLKEHSVAVVPGGGFGESGIPHIRCSYASSFNNIEIALERMAKFMKTI